MDNQLCAARELVEAIRFSGDTRRPQAAATAAGLAAIRNHFYQNELLISYAVTPTLHERLQAVYQRLLIPEVSVEAFVYASPEMQASCLSDETSECVVRFTSRLAEAMSPQEFEFVVGHELGHFLLQHGGVEHDQKSLESFMQMRSREISADRTGLIACNSLDAAVRAMMKLFSGLTEQHLNFDVGTFISQLKNSSSNANEIASHPSMLVRCRALLWFSMSGYLGMDKKPSRETLAKIDESIEKDLHRYIDGPIRNRIERAKENFSMWKMAREITEDKVFDKSEQTRFSEVFGEKTLASLKNFLQDIPGSRVQEVLDERVRIARDELEVLIPSAFAEEVTKIECRVKDWLSRT